jgi:hypothetical protein
MFEGSLIKNNRTKTPAGMVIGVAGQVSAIGLAVLIPLVYNLNYAQNSPCRPRVRLI